MCAFTEGKYALLFYLFLFLFYRSHHAVLNVIYQKRETVIHRDIKTSRRVRVVFFDEIRGVWIADETLSRVFDI